MIKATVKAFKAITKMFIPKNIPASFAEFVFTIASSITSKIKSATSRAKQTKTQIIAKKASFSLFIL